MNVVVVTFASGPAYDGMRKDLEAELSAYGISSVPYGRGWLESTSEYRDHPEIFGLRGSWPRDAMFWAWKPMVLIDAMNTAGRQAETDLFIYCDASVRLRENPLPYCERVGSIGVKAVPHRNDNYTHNRCFSRMGCDDGRYRSAVQVWAGMVAIRQNEEGRSFVEEWRKNCLDHMIVTDEAMEDIDKPAGFQQHRYDQSVLSLLVEKYHIDCRTSVPFRDYGTP